MGERERGRVAEVEALIREIQRYLQLLEALRNSVAFPAGRTEPTRPENGGRDRGG
jgi:hypothetical protein